MVGGWRWGLLSVGLYQTLYLAWSRAAETMIIDHVDMGIRNSRQAEYIVDGESLFRTDNATPYQVERRGEIAGASQIAELGRARIRGILQRMQPGVLQS